MKTSEEKKRVYLKSITRIVVGSLLITLGLLGVYFFVLQGIKPNLLQWNVFTVYSKFLESNYFTIIQNNQGDELAILSYCLGWLFIFYEKNNSIISKETLAIMFFALGYLLFHGLGCVYFIFAFLLLLPLIFVIRCKYGSLFSNNN